MPVSTHSVLKLTVIMCLYQRIRSAPLVLPPLVGPEAADLLRSLLHKDPALRLGSRGAAEVRDHGFFAELDWRAVLAKEVSPPINPCAGVAGGADELASVANFDAYFTAQNPSSPCGSADEATHGGGGDASATHGGVKDEHKGDFQPPPPTPPPNIWAGFDFAGLEFTFCAGLAGSPDDADDPEQAHDAQRRRLSASGRATPDPFAVCGVVCGANH